MMIDRSQRVLVAAATALAMILGVFGVVLAVPSASHAADAPDRVPAEEVSIQLFNFFRYVGFDASVEAQERQEEVLSRVAGMGYTNVEPVDYAGFQGLSAVEYRALLDGFGLRASGLHTSVSMETSDEDWAAAVDRAVTIGAPYIGAGSTPRLETEEEWIAYAEKIDHLGALSREQGVQYMVHSHNWEFTTVFGEKTAFDILQENTSAENVVFEFDLYWSSEAGVDPVDVIDAYGDRIKLLHVKDMAEDGSITTVGAGTIDFASVFAAAGPGIDFYVVERDAPSDDASFDPFGPAEASIAHLYGLQFEFPASVSADAESVALTVGQSAVVSATVAPAAAHQNVIWASQDEAVATVAADGTVTAVAAGETAVTAIAGADRSVTATIAVAVAPVETTAATLTLSAETVKAGTALTATAAGFEAQESVTFALVAADASARTTAVDLGAGTADADGAFEQSIRVPADVAAGDYVLVASGAASGQSAQAELTVAAAATQPGTGGTTGSTGSGDLAVTGGAGAEPWMLSMGALLLLAGAVLVVARRRVRS